jgi:two-component system, response regulator RegA
VHDAHLLIVEDHARLATSLRSAFEPRVKSVEVVGTAAAAIEALDQKSPEWLLLDLFLPDQSGFVVLEAAQKLERVPHTVVLSSSQSPADAFRLAKLGVAAYLEKPADLDRIEKAFTEPPVVDLAQQVRGLVGHRTLESIEEEVRSSLVTEALARAAGSKSGAARLLSVSRQLLQYMLRQRE